MQHIRDIIKLDKKYIKECSNYLEKGKQGHLSDEEKNALDHFNYAYSVIFPYRIEVCYNYTESNNDPKIQAFGLLDDCGLTIGKIDSDYFLGRFESDISPGDIESELMCMIKDVFREETKEISLHHVDRELLVTSIRNTIIEIDQNLNDGKYIDKTFKVKFCDFNR